MATKHYEAPDTIISNLSLNVNGRPVRINFSPISIHEGSHTGKGSMLVTSNPRLQESIEKCPLFNKRIFIYRVVEENEEQNASANVEKPKVEVVSETEVSSLNDAREYLVKKFGYTKQTLPTRRAINNAAKAHSIEFAALKEKE